MSFEDDFRRLGEMSRQYNLKPPDAIGVNPCMSNFREETPDHKPFVVERITWEGDKITGMTPIGEFATLNQALAVPGAKPWGTADTCSSCVEYSKKIRSTMTADQYYERKYPPRTKLGQK